MADKKKILIWVNNYNTFEEAGFSDSPEIKKIMGSIIAGDTPFGKDITLEGAFLYNLAKKFRDRMNAEFDFLEVQICGHFTNTNVDENKGADMINEWANKSPNDYICIIQLSLGYNDQRSVTMTYPLGDVISLHLSNVITRCLRKKSLENRLIFKKPVLIKSCRSEEPIGRQTETNGLEGVTLIEKSTIPCVLLQFTLSSILDILGYYWTNAFAESGYDIFSYPILQMGFPRNKEKCNFEEEKPIFSIEGAKQVKEFKDSFDAYELGLWQYCENIEKYYGKNNSSATKSFFTGYVKDKLVTTRDEQAIRNAAQSFQDGATPIEQEMGEGGDQRTFHLRNHDIVVGTNPPQLPAVVTDNNGSLVTTPKVTPSGVVMSESTAPSYVVNDMGYTPTGHMRLAAMSTLKIESAQVDIFSKGRNKITGAVVSFEGGSAIDLVTGGGTSLTLKSGTSFFTGNVDINQNLNIGGSLTAAGGGVFQGNVFSQGGFYSNSFNGVKKPDYTESTQVFVKPVPGAFINGKITGTIKINQGGQLMGNVEYPFETIGDAKMEISSSGPSGPSGGCFGISEPHIHRFFRLNGSLSDDSSQMMRQV